MHDFYAMLQISHSSFFPRRKPLFKIQLQSCKYCDFLPSFLSLRLFQDQSLIVNDRATHNSRYFRRRSDSCNVITLKKIALNCLSVACQFAFSIDSEFVRKFNSDSKSNQRFFFQIKIFSSIFFTK